MAKKPTAKKAPVKKPTAKKAPVKKAEVKTEPVIHPLTRTPTEVKKVEAEVKKAPIKKAEVKKVNSKIDLDLINSKMELLQSKNDAHIDLIK